MKRKVVWLLIVCLIGCMLLISCFDEEPEISETGTTAGTNAVTTVTGEKEDLPTEEKTTEAEPEDPTPEDNLYGKKNWTKNY